MNIFISVLIFAIILAVILIVIFSKKKTISNSNKKDFIGKLRKLSNSNLSHREKIIEYDKLYHYILKAYGYKGTFGEILKQKPSIISDLNKIWEIHKIRNKLAHDLDHIETNKLKHTCIQFETEIKKILN